MPEENTAYPESWWTEQDPDDCDDLSGFCARLPRTRLKSGLSSVCSMSFLTFSLHTHVAQAIDKPTDVTGAAIPQIVITPCPTEPRDPSCLVPFQDSLFNTRLTVPNHPTVNSVFPPLLPDVPVSQRPLRAVEMWRYERGHWLAVLPSVEEQARRGLFSRGLRTKGCAARRRTRAGHGVVKAR